MKCEIAQQNMVFAGYGELHDEQIDGLEEHLAGCEACRQEFEALKLMQEQLALYPMLEPSPNLLAQSRMRLDEELDQIPAHGFLTHVRSLFFGSLASIRTSPALTVLLVGAGFFGGYFTFQYQAANAPHLPGVIRIAKEANSTVAKITGIVRTPDSEIIQVNYNKVIPETVQGSLDEPEIRKLLMMGSLDRGTESVRENSVALLASECKAGHRCLAEGHGDGVEGEDIRTVLMVALRYDQNPAVRLSALQGLEPYVAKDKRVRDAILESMVHDTSMTVREAEFKAIPPVQSDSSVRQVLRKLSVEDENPYIRTASFNALQSSGDIQ
jgi:HEAT repeats/Putative zinc-finger